MPKRFPVEGKVAVVTGAAGGIGFGTASALHARGANVVLLDLDEAATVAAAASISETDTLGMAADVTDRVALKRAFDAAVERFGGIDIVIANAGIAPPIQTIRATEDETFDAIIAVNLTGVWNTVKAGLPQVIERRGHIHVVASIYAFFNGLGQAPYAMSKAGVEQLGRALRAELSIHGATAGIAYFGFIDTAMVQSAFDDPLGQKVKKVVPPGLGKMLPPAAAGEAIAVAVERRKIQVIRPRGWWIPQYGRGFLVRAEQLAIGRDKRVQAIIREGDQPASDRLASRDD